MKTWKKYKKYGKLTIYDDKNTVRNARYGTLGSPTDLGEFISSLRAELDLAYRSGFVGADIRFTECYGDDSYSRYGYDGYQIIAKRLESNKEFDDRIASLKQAEEAKEKERKETRKKVQVEFEERAIALLRKKGYKVTK